MTKIVLSLILAASAAFGQYTSGPAGAPPSELSPAVTAMLQKEGIKILDGDKVFCEIWLRTTAPNGPKSAEDSVSLPNIPQGSLLGAIRFPEKGKDRRGNQIAAGVYTLRYSNFPQNGDHQGVAPQRDFMLISKAADDKDPKATPSFKELVATSEKAMGIPHPGVFSFWKADGTAGLSKDGETDWVLHTKLGDLGIAMIVVGKVEG
ncbi:MAG: hypothetical protein ABJF23_24490 [Bryobacteraceae bacterium]